MVELKQLQKQLQKQLETKDAKTAKAEQVAYDASMTKSMTKTAESLTAQLKVVAWAFCLEVWGQALNVARISTASELRAPNKVYYPLALRLALSPSQPSTDLGQAPTSFSTQPTTTPFATPTKDKEKEQPTPTNVVEVEGDN